MSRTRKTLAICLAIAIISTIIQIVILIVNPEAVSISVLVSTGIVPIVLCIALLSSKKDDKK